MDESSQARLQAARQRNAWIQSFFPGYFGFVMATGIVSLACHFQGFERIAKALLWLNIPAYLLLWGITLVRFFRFRADLLKDLTSHGLGATFLTIVAATGVLGKQVVILTSLGQVGKCLWVLAVVLWFVLIYSFFVAITVREPKPKPENALNGGWLLTVVATESLCTLGTMVAPSFDRPDLIFFTSLCAYFLGAMFYTVLITLILYRWFFLSMKAITLTPPYWINMGALAITTLAGARLMMVAEQAPQLARFIGFIPGLNLFFWATATWWIPLLLLVGVWRHIGQRLPLRYEPQYWSLVFPLGMYSSATFAFAQAGGLPFLLPLARVFAFIALLAWSITSIGLVAQMISLARPAGRDNQYQ